MKDSENLLAKAFGELTTAECKLSEACALITEAHLRGSSEAFLVHKDRYDNMTHRLYKLRTKIQYARTVLRKLPT